LLAAVLLADSVSSATALRAYQLPAIRLLLNAGAAKMSGLMLLQHYQV
jgi:hypothetical protein